MASITEKIQIGRDHNAVDSFGVLERTRRSVLTDTSVLSSVLAKVPVVVLLAMNPATLNSAIPKAPETENPNQIVMLAPETKSPEKSTYVMKPETQETQQSDAPYGWVSLKEYKIPYVTRGKNPMYGFNMLFATNLYTDYRKVTDVFIVEDDQYPSNDIFTPPPRVEELYYHNTGDGKEYYGAYIADPISDKDGNRVLFRRHEVKIDDNTAKQIINLIKGKTKWINETHILFYETNSAQRQESIDY